MTGIQGIHELSIELTVTVTSQGHNGLLAYTLIAWLPTVEPQQTKTIAELKGEWPNKLHPTFDSCIFNELYKLDHLISRAYQENPF
jgi:hypothetical protein